MFQKNVSVVVFSFFLGGVLFLSGCMHAPAPSEIDEVNMMETTPTATPTTTMEENTNMVTSSALVDAPADGDENVTFILSGKNFVFTMDGQENPELRVQEGDRVRIEFESESGFHDWVVDEFGAATKQVQTGSTTSVEFVADTKGTFEYYCSVGKHRENGMKGNLIVE